MIRPNPPDRFDDENLPLDELDTHPGDPSRPPLRGHWLGGRKPTPEKFATAREALRDLRNRAKPGPETLQELRDEGRRH